MMDGETAIRFAGIVIEGITTSQVHHERSTESQFDDYTIVLIGWVNVGYGTDVRYAGCVLYRPKLKSLHFAGLFEQKQAKPGFLHDDPPRSSRLAVFWVLILSFNVPIHSC